MHYFRWRNLIVCLIPFSFLWASNNQHPDPLSVLSEHYAHKQAIAEPEESAVRWEASKRSLASYGRMKHEYLGSTHTSPAVISDYDLNVYSKHVCTGNPYLDAKAIDGPLPEDYSRLYLKAKTLLDLSRIQIRIVVNKSRQRIYVYRDLEHLYTFKSSTGMEGHRTPSGVFKPYTLEAMHYSKKYYNSPMPWSVFFYHGFAIHGTENIKDLGHAASHGCVRTHPVSARRIYRLVQRYGMSNTTVILTY